MSSRSVSRPGALTSPFGNDKVRDPSYLSCHPFDVKTVKLEDGAQHKNLRVFSVSTGDELAAFTQKGFDGWELQFTISESHAVRLVGQEIQVFHPAEWSKGVVDKVKVEGVTSIALSPGLNPSVAVFVAEKNVRCVAICA